MKGFEGSSVTSVGTVNVKAQFNSDIRRFVLSSISFAALEVQLRTVFSVPASSVVDFLYRDDEGDLVNMSSDAELNHAILSSGDLLRVVVKPRDIENATSFAPALAPAFRGRRDFGGRGGFGGFGGRGGGFGGFGGFGGRGRGGFGGFSGFFGDSTNQPVAENASMDLSEKTPFAQGVEPFGGGRGFGKRHLGHYRHDHKDKHEKRQKLVARHVKDVTIPDGTQLVPRVPFVKVWRIRNEGVEWPEGCRLMFVSRQRGDIMGAPEFVPIEGKVAPGSEVDISVNMIAPEEPGHYNGFWKMCTADGKKFGQRLWVSIQVLGSSSSSSSDERAEIEAGRFDEFVKRIEGMGFDFPKRKVERLLRKYGGNVNDVVQALIRKSAKREAKGVKSCKRH